MKKKFNKLWILLVVAMLLSLFSCGGDGSGTDPTGPGTITESTERSDQETTTPVPDITVPQIEETKATQPATEVPEADSTFTIHYIDVGQADAALVECDGHYMLIDGGNREDSDLIYSYLRNHGVTHLDYMICSHAHADHVGGLAGALNYATVDIAYCPVTEYDSDTFRNFTKYLGKQGIEITVPEPGDTFSLGSAAVQILGPISPSDEPNNTSIVLRIEYGMTSFLFTGDAELEEESEILNAGYDISCTVLKVGHHGSDSSTSYRWLREAAPKYAVISVGDDNEYGHPTENTLSKLRDADVTVFRTDMQGDIICTSDGKNVSFSVEYNPNADTLAGAGAGGNHAKETEPEDTQSGTTGSDAADPGADQQTYILNTNTKKFHYPSCSSVDQMSDRNKKEVVANREDLIEDGYDPCGRCHP